MPHSLVKRGVLVANLCAVEKMILTGDAREIGSVEGVDREFCVMQAAVPDRKGAVAYFVIPSPLVEPTSEEEHDQMAHETFECPSYMVDGTDPDAVAEGMMRALRKASALAVHEVVQVQKDLKAALTT